MTTEAIQPVDVAAPEANTPVAPPAPPRPVTRLVRRRAWTEPRVRFWWMSALAMFLVGAVVCGREVLLWYHEARLIRGGLPVDAEVKIAGGYSSPGKALPPDSVVTIEYTVKGTKYRQDGYLRGRTRHIEVRKTVPIRVDPDDPEDWTGRTEPAVLSRQLLGGVVAFPAFLVLLVIALMKRAAVLGTWRDGEAVAALVVETSTTAIAPRSRAVRCTPADDADNRVADVYVPPGPATSLQPGDALWLIRPPGGRGRAVAAAWFE